MYKYILISALVLIGAFPNIVHNADRELGMADYIVKYLEVFPNLTFTEVRAAVRRESRDNPKTKVHERTVNDFSWGPLCVRSKTLYGMGFKGSPEKMKTWETGLYWGMKYMSLCKTRARASILAEYGVADEHLIRRRMYSLYNAGNLYFTTVIEDGKEHRVYRNRAYVRYCEHYYWKYLKYDPKIAKVGKVG